MVAITDSDGWVPVTRPEITDIALGGNEANFPGKFFRELASRDKYLYEQALGGDAQSIASAVAFRQLGIAAVAQGRLTLETGVPVSTTDQLAKTVLYYTPYNGDYVALYDTGLSRWDLYQFTEISLSLSGLAADTNYDIFLWDNSGTLTLEAVAWSNSGAGTSTRASAISQLDGIWVKNSDKRRYLGMIRTTATVGQCEDSATKRLVGNVSNNVERYCVLTDLTNNLYDGWWRYYDNNSSNQIQTVSCERQWHLISVSAHLSGDSNSVGVGLNGDTPSQPVNFVDVINSAQYAGGGATIATTVNYLVNPGFNFFVLSQSGIGEYGFFGAKMTFSFIG